ncbi:hypothetical protein ACLF92_07605, partial [Helicobacter pylori]
PLKLKIFKNQSIKLLKKKFQGIMFVPLLIFHGKLLFRIYPHNCAYGGVCFTTIFSNLKKRSQKPLKSEITLQDELFCGFY